MSNALENIVSYEEGNTSVLKTEKWLKYLVMTSERRVNVEHLNTMEDVKENNVLRYVKATLLVLDDLAIPKYEKAIVETVLKWSEVAKCGTKYHREKWLSRQINLYAHNEGSADIYRDHIDDSLTNDEILVYTLIHTHGLLGQYLRGEIGLHANKPLYDLVQKELVSKDALFCILLELNKCIIAGVSETLWTSVEDEILHAITRVLNGDFTEEINTIAVIEKLRNLSIQNGEDVNSELHNIRVSETASYLGASLDNLSTIFGIQSLWYVEAALHDFSLHEFIKIFSLLATEKNLKHANHISFEPLMRDLYYDYNGVKKVNIYKKRIIEHYLRNLSLEDIFQSQVYSNPHVAHTFYTDPSVLNVMFVNFSFSPAGSKLIDFCVEAEKAGLEYEKAPLMLFDVFGLRRDKYDRFHNEEAYLESMNSSVDFKKVVLDYIVGETIVDIGPGGGVMLDLIEEKDPSLNAIGVDISQNVIEALAKKKTKEGKKWSVMQGDALNLEETFRGTKVDTLVFSSILHEIFSYCEHEGKQFNQDIISIALKSAFNVLSDGGRIIIRDGIMTEPGDQNRIIKFSSDEGLKFVERYVADFQGRQIHYEVTGHNEVKMPVNDAMECLYTYTWGEESYVHEVQEQFGYFTPSQYIKCISDTLGNSVKIITNKHFLQDGYTQALSPKITFMDEHRQEVPLPDSTCLIVIEKLGDYVL